MVNFIIHLFFETNQLMGGGGLLNNRSKKVMDGHVGLGRHEGKVSNKPSIFNPSHTHHQQQQATTNIKKERTSQNWK